MIPKEADNRLDIKVNDKSSGSIAVYRALIKNEFWTGKTTLDSFVKIQQ